MVETLESLLRARTDWNIEFEWEERMQFRVHEKLMASALAAISPAPHTPPPRLAPMAMAPWRKETADGLPPQGDVP